MHPMGSRPPLPTPPPPSPPPPPPSSSPSSSSSSPSTFPDISHGGGSPPSSPAPTGLPPLPEGTERGGGGSAAGSAAPDGAGGSGSSSGGGDTSDGGGAGDGDGSSGGDNDVCEFCADCLAQSRARESRGGGTGGSREGGGGPSGTGPAGSGGSAAGGDGGGGGNGGGEGGGHGGGGSAPTASSGSSPDADGDGDGGSGGHSAVNAPAGSGGSLGARDGSGGDGGGGITDDSPGDGVLIEGDDDASGEGSSDDDGDGSSGDGGHRLSESGSDVTAHSDSHPLVMVTERSVLEEVAFVLDRPPHALSDSRRVEWLSTPMGEETYRTWQAEQANLMNSTQQHVSGLLHGCLVTNSLATAIPPFVVRMPYPLARMTIDDENDVPSGNSVAAIFFDAPPRHRHGGEAGPSVGRRPGLRLPRAPPLQPFMEILFYRRDLPPVAVAMALYLMYRARLVLSELVICDRSIYRLLAAAAEMVAEDVYGHNQSTVAAEDARRAAGDVWGDVAAKAVEDAQVLANLLRLVVGDAWEVDDFDAHWLAWYLRLQAECHRYTCCRAVAASSSIRSPTEGAVFFYEGLLATVSGTASDGAVNRPPSAMPWRASAEGGTCIAAVVATEHPPSAGDSSGDAERGGPAAAVAAANSSTPPSEPASGVSTPAPERAFGSSSAAAARGASSAAAGSGASSVAAGSGTSSAPAGSGAFAPAAASPPARPSVDWLEGLSLAPRHPRQPPRRSRTSRQQRAEAVAQAGRAAAAADAEAATSAAAVAGDDSSAGQAVGGAGATDRASATRAVCHDSDDNGSGDAAATAAARRNSPARGGGSSSSSSARGGRGGASSSRIARGGRGRVSSSDLARGGRVGMTATLPTAAAVAIDGETLSALPPPRGRRRGPPDTLRGGRASPSPPRPARAAAPSGERRGEPASTPDRKHDDNDRAASSSAGPSGAAASASGRRRSQRAPPPLPPPSMPPSPSMPPLPPQRRSSRPGRPPTPVTTPTSTTATDVEVPLRLPPPRGWKSRGRGDRPSLREGRSGSPPLARSAHSPGEPRAEPVPLSDNSDPASSSLVPSGELLSSSLPERPLVGVPLPEEARSVRGDGDGDGDDGGDSDGGRAGHPTSARQDPNWPALSGRGDDEVASPPAPEQPSRSDSATGPFARPAAGPPSQVLSSGVSPGGGSPLAGPPVTPATAEGGHQLPAAPATATAFSHAGGTRAVPAAVATQALPAAVATQAVPSATSEAHEVLPAVATLRGDPVFPLPSGVWRQPPIGTPPAVSSPSGTRWSAREAMGAGPSAPAAAPSAAGRLPAFQAAGFTQTATSSLPPRPPVIDRVYSLWPMLGITRDGRLEPLPPPAPARSPPRVAAPPASIPLARARVPFGASRGVLPSEPGVTVADPVFGASPAATSQAATGVVAPPRRPFPQRTTADATSLPLPTMSTVESTPLVPQLPVPPPFPPRTTRPSGGPPPIHIPPGTDMEAVVAAALTARAPHFPDPLWPPFTADLPEVHAWRAAVTDAAAAAAVAVRWRHAAAAAAAAVVPPGVVPPTSATAVSSAAVAVATANTASAVMRRATERVTVYPLLVAGAPATALPIRHGPGVSPFFVSTPCAVTPTGTPDVRVVLTELAAGVPGGLPPVTLVTAVALLHRYQGVDPVGAVLSPYTAGRLLAAALLAAGRTPGVPPLPATAVTGVGALGVADVQAAAVLELELVIRLAGEGAVVGLAEQEATTWLLLWHWGPPV